MRSVLGEDVAQCVMWAVSDAAVICRQLDFNLDGKGGENRKLDQVAGADRWLDTFYGPPLKKKALSTAINFFEKAQKDK